MCHMHVCTHICTYGMLTKDTEDRVTGILASWQKALIRWQTLRHTGFLSQGPYQDPISLQGFLFPDQFFFVIFFSFLLERSLLNLNLCSKAKLQELTCPSHQVKPETWAQEQWRYCALGNWQTPFLKRTWLAMLNSHTSSCHPSLQPAVFCWNAGGSVRQEREEPGKEQMMLSTTAVRQ